MPVLAFGTWQYNSSVAQSGCEVALDTGFDHFDTAHDYENQDGVAIFWSKATAKTDRSKLYLTTKVPGCGQQGVGGGKKCYADTAKFMQEDLDLLKTDYVDLMLLHFPPTNCGSGKGCQEVQDSWRAAEEFYKAGKAKAIGVSNYCQSCFECLAQTSTVTPAVNQVQYHIGMGVDPEGLRTYCDAKGIVMQAYSPLGDGSKELITGPLVTSIGKNHGKSGAQVSLKWVLQNGVPVVFKTTSPSHLVENLDMFSWNLTDTEMAQLNAATTPANTPSFACKK